LRSSIRGDTLLGPWDSNPQTTNGRVHAGVFDNDGNTLYLANEGGNELIAMDPLNGAVLWRLSVPGIHELAVTHNGKLAYVSQRSQNKLSVVDLETPSARAPAAAHPWKSRYAATVGKRKLLTVGLASPAQMAVVDTSTFDELVTLSEPGQTTTIAGHQWTSPSGRYTFASFEGGTRPGVAVIDHFEGNTVVQRLAYAGRPHGVDFAHP
jgi:hypothetical protein